MRANTIGDFLEVIAAIKPNESGCLIWPRAANQSGYGGYKIRRKRTPAHRLALITSGVQIPEGACVMHICDVPLCVNTRHLRIGTWGENNRDRASKGRSAVGERAGRSKLTPEKVRRIRGLYAADEKTTTEIGHLFGVSNHQVSMIGLNKSWRHLK